MNHLQTTDHNLEAKPRVMNVMRWCDVIPDEEREFAYKMQKKTSHFSWDYTIWACDTAVLRITACHI